MAGWFLSFDCATKTFAYSVCYIDLDSAKLATMRKKLNTIIELMKRSVFSDELLEAAKRLDLESQQMIQIHAGATVDLCEGIADNDIPTVDRIRAVVAYVNGTIKPVVDALDVPYRVVIEYQMGQNIRARAVATALITLFSDKDIIIVGPSLKNKIATCELGKYCYFAERYKTSYSANKAHTIFNFAQLESAFGTKIPPITPVSKRGHIADSVLQIIGFLIHGSGVSHF
jgi:hypothetical protein